MAMRCVLCLLKCWCETIGGGHAAFYWNCATVSSIMARFQVLGFRAQCLGFYTTSTILWRVGLSLLLMRHYLRSMQMTDAAVIRTHHWWSEFGAGPED